MWLVLAISVAGACNSALAFSMAGATFPSWETSDISYNAPPIPGDVFAVVDLGEGYRWNIKTVTYGFDPSFLKYFGQRGVDEINKAMAILNNLPPVSSMSPSLSEFAEDTRRENYQAETLGIFDLKSTALGVLVGTLGLASPERYVWTLHAREALPFVTNYFVISRNFDPVTLAPSPYVNGVLYTYSIFEFGPTPQFADAVEILVDPLAFPFTSVASATQLYGGLIAVDPLGGGVIIGSSQNPGQFYIGLTRDDVGGLRYLYSKLNYNTEGLLAGTIGGSPGSWMPVGSGGTSTNLVNFALRPGVEKIVFKQMKNDSVFGGFITITNQYTDTYVTNSHRVNQRTARVLSQPDIVFASGDLGNAANVPVVLGLFFAPWSNNGTLNSLTDTTGPGVINPSFIITFSNIGPVLQNQFPGFLQQENAAIFFGGWGAIDGTTNVPYLFPQGASIQQLEQIVLNPGN
jgi:hypothetical protein